MITREDFHVIFNSLPFENDKIETYLYDVFVLVMNNLIDNTSASGRIQAKENLILDYVLQEFIYQLPGKKKEDVDRLIQDDNFTSQFIKIVSDKVFFNEITPYHALTLLSHQSPVISTIELNINFILNRMTLLQKEYPKKDILLDMFTKVFLMFKSVNYLLSSGFETEAFSTWRTIHELECVIKVISDNPDIIPVYLKHIVYNNAFRDEFEDKEAQQAAIDDLKIHMKSHDLKSKDMKKYIEYGWLYAVENLDEKYPNFKLNFRNGLEVIAGLEKYSFDYEMSSEVAHSSPLLIYSNKSFFKGITIVRSYESFLRLEEIFYKYLKEHDKVDASSYENMRKLYNGFVRRILQIETKLFNKEIEDSTEIKRNLAK